jgi:hypothetical protein
MKTARIIFFCLITQLFHVNATDAKTLNQFYNQILGKWYVTQWQGRWYITAIGSALFEMEEYPSSGDSVIVTIPEASDSVCVPADLALQAESDPGDIRWYNEPEGGIPIANGRVFFPNDISEFPKGFYVVILQDNSSVQVMKIIKL